jgi:hypothetical protein
MAIVMTEKVRGVLYERKERVYGYGGRRCKRKGCQEKTVTDDVPYCPRHWERKYRCVYPALTWRSERDKLQDWREGRPTPLNPSYPESIQDN